MAPLRLPDGARVAVAVSGGADSMALAHLLSQWAAPRGIHLSALTVDHGLRDAAAGEAAQVAAWLAPLPHATLRWEEGAEQRTRPGSAQNAAREARYRLMTDWCAAQGCTHLFLAHHADDQVETFLLRLARGSGVDGLAAMATETFRDGIALARPLLGFTKEQLMETCRAFGQVWIEDPSNQNTGSARVRFRESRALLDREGLTRERLLATVGHLQRARAALDHAVCQLLRSGTWDDFAVFRIPLAEILAAPEEIGLRALARILTMASGGTYGPRFESLAALYARLTTGPWSDASLHGCLVSRVGPDVVVSREPAAITDERTLRAAGSVVWDGRFRLTLVGPEGTAFTIARMREWSFAPEEAPDNYMQLSHAFRGTIPALYDFKGVAAVPHAGYVRADVAAMTGFSLGLTCVLGGGAKL
jgi:tRNA(Ile)-lysidine synthase